MVKKTYMTPQTTAVAMTTVCTILAGSGDNRQSTTGSETQNPVQKYDGDDDVIQRAKGQNVWESWDD